MNSPFNLTIDSKGIATIIFDLPGEKVNKLSPPILEELEKILDQIAVNPEIKALVFKSGKSETFIAGADLHMFAPAFDQPEKIKEMISTGHRVFNKLSELPFPSIAVIHGACFGGGLELALACTYRIVLDHPKTQLALPEVNLGIFPGWGGTQRLPRLVGLQEGVEMILTGKPAKALKAWKIHLADAIYPYEFSEQKIPEFVKLILSPTGHDQVIKNRTKRDFTHYLLEGNPIGRFVFFQEAKRKLLQKTKGHYPAPVAALDLIEKTYPLPLKQGLKQEEEFFVSSIPPGPFVNAKNLIALFFIQEALKKNPGVEITAQPKPIKTTGVLGAGTMGGGIAFVLSNNNLPVRLKDINWDAIGKGFSTANALYSRMIKAKKIKPNDANLKFHQISGTLDYSGFANLDIIFEAVVENLALKKQIFAELEEHIRPDAIVASNTSSLTVADMSSEAKYPERFIALHFFNPPNRMPLVEVVPGPKTSPEVLATAVDFCRKIGKTPIVVGDCHGFLVNRIFALGANETVRMFEEGGQMDAIAKALLAFGLPMDPFLLADEVGNDVSYKVAKVFQDAYGSRMAPPELLKEMYEHKLYGKKTGEGFYLYDGSKTKPNPQVLKMRKGTEKQFSNQEIIDRVIYLMINEAARCLQEKVVSKPELIDMALIMGIGFPPFRGGLLRYADEVGIDSIVLQLENFEKQYGDRFQPCDKLREMVRNGQKFYEQR